ncbi:MAG: helix-turn-helix transcriptional regulator [Butyrivibrio sp.]|nr:helix-turn-helix transcriptional regulator [Butyrivibrio sp.]MBR1640930.1 helix-turn-helix transcriptional regulator [Butyrivibrio sp.]
MAKKKYGNKRVADAIRAARGERSLREYAADANVNYMTIYKLEKGESSPTPETIKRLTTGAARPRNNITYDTVMIAAGYQLDKNKEIEEIKDITVAEALASKPHILPAREIYRSTEGIKFRHYALGLLSVMIKNNENLKIQSINYPMHEKDARSLDMKVYLDDDRISEWWFDYRHIIPDSRRYLETYAFLIIGRLSLLLPDKKRKTSIVLDDPNTFSYLKNLANRVSYKGDLSVILIDIDEGMIVDETYISHYEDVGYKEIFIV